MSKFNIGDTVVIADPAYLVVNFEAKGYVSPTAYGKTGTIQEITEEGDSDTIIGTAYVVDVEGLGFTQTISQHYLSAAPAPEPAPEPIADGVYRETGSYPDTVLVRDGKVVEVLITTDGCTDEIGLADHLRWLQAGDDRLEGLVRLVAPKVEKPVADGIYVDDSGDIVQIKDGQHRDLQSFGTVLPTAYYEEPIYGPYTPVVTETEADTK